MAKRNRKCKSVKDELLKKAREAMLAAVQIYNNPLVEFKAEAFIVLAQIAWTYLFHAYYKSNKIECRYLNDKKGDRHKFKQFNNRDKLWDLSQCLKSEHCPLDKASIENLKFINKIRDEIEHEMTDRINEFVSAKLQACALNFDFYLVQLFGEKYKVSDTLALSIQFAPVVPEQLELLKKSSRFTTNIRNFVARFEKDLDEEIYNDPHYSYHVAFTEYVASSKGGADTVATFVRPTPELLREFDNAQRVTIFKDREKPKHLPNEIEKIMHDHGYVKFKFNPHHNDLWKARDARNPKYNYGVWVGKQWYWYDNWLQEVLKYCEENRDKFC